jgi:hypothetical protein
VNVVQRIEQKMGIELRFQVYEFSIDGLFLQLNFLNGVDDKILGNPNQKADSQKRKQGAKSHTGTLSLVLRVVEVDKQQEWNGTRQKDRYQP